MFELKISGLRQAKQLATHWATYTISLLDPGIDHFMKEINSTMKIPMMMPGKKIIRCYFHDIVSENDFLILLTEDSKPTLATITDIKEILAFTTFLNDKDKLLIHCQAGISRSTAVACGVLCQQGLAPLEAIQYVLSIRPQASPNQHILKLFDEVLELEGQLITEMMRMNEVK